MLGQTAAPSVNRATRLPDPQGEEQPTPGACQLDSGWHVIAP